MPAKGFVFECHGARVGIRANMDCILAAMRDRLPPASKIVDSERPTCFFSIVARKAAGERSGKYWYRLYRRRRLLVQVSNLDQVLVELESRLHFAVAVESPALFVHAGVVGWNQGAIVIPGRSGSGKSTLVAALVGAGADHYSDEYAVFDEAGRVHAYPKPLSLRQPYEGRRGKCSAAELGGRCGTKPIPVKLLVATRYAEHACWQPQSMSPGQAVLRLLDNTIHARTRARHAIEIFARVAAGARNIGGDRPSWDQVMPSLLALCPQASSASTEAADQERTGERGDVLTH